MGNNSMAVKIARQLRKKMTKAEKVLWRELRNRKWDYKIRRQEPFAFGENIFIADFYCVEARLVIEIDGPVHLTEENIVYDELREAIFKYYGYEVIRFTNKEVFTELGRVLDEIILALRRPLTPTPLPRGEGGGVPPRRDDGG